MEKKMKNLDLAETLKGGVIMDVTTPEQAKIAEEQAPARLWRLSVSRPTSVPQAA